MIDFRAAVFGLIDVSPCRHRERVGLDGGWVDSISECEFEAIRFGAHLENFKRSFPCRADALKGEGFAASAGPAAVAATNKQSAVVAETHGNNAGFETGEVFDHGALVDAVDLFEEYTLDFRVSLLADQDLIGKRAKFPARLIVDDGCRGLADFAVGEHHSGRHELGNAFAFDVDA